MTKSHRLSSPPKAQIREISVKKQKIDHRHVSKYAISQNQLHRFFLNLKVSQTSAPNLKSKTITFKNSCEQINI